MARKKPFKPDDYPPEELLRELVSEVEAQCGSERAPSILKLAPAACFPQPLTPCFEVCVSDMARCSFVLSQKRSGGQQYVSVIGKRAHIGAKGVKKERSTVPWPRTLAMDRQRPIALHRWITVVLRGHPPSIDHQATHICGNDRCIAGSHLHWQLQADNLRDESFHHHHSPSTKEPSTRHFSRLSWQE